MAHLSDLFANWQEQRTLLDREEAYLIPCECCLTSSRPRPAEKSNPATIEGEVSISLETSSPFPLDDIFWGYFENTTSGNIQIFSALKSRIKDLDANAPHATYLLPDCFIPIFDPSINRAILKHQEHETFFQRDVNGELTFSEEIPDRSQIPVVEIVEVIPVREFGLVVHYTWRTNAGSDAFEKVLEIPYNDPRLHALNMQVGLFKKVTENNKRTADITRIVSVASVAVILATVGGWFLFKSLAGHQVRVSRKLTAKEKQVKSVQSKDDRAHELELFSDRKQAYFRGLDKINALRPESILFKSLHTSEGENFEIRGVATSLEESERFQRALEESQQFRIVKLVNEGLDNEAHIQFSLSLTFRKL
ncbi:MAG: hypothetical protein K2L24_03170 [Opitutales bacterium]|nr:hypothetical protein [Opitutales bacterium]